MYFSSILLQGIHFSIVVLKKLYLSTNNIFIDRIRVLPMYLLINGIAYVGESLPAENHIEGKKYEEQFTIVLDTL
jgi:hypothetical protein